MKILSHWRAALFHESSIHSIKGYANWKNALLYFFFAVLFQALPLTAEDLQTFLPDFVGILWKVALAMIAVYMLAKLFHSHEPMVKYWYAVSAVLFVGAFLMAVAAYISLFIFEELFNNPVISNLIASILPYYFIVLFAFTAESAMNLEGKKAAILGTFAVLVLYSLYFFL